MKYIFSFFLFLVFSVSVFADKINEPAEITVTITSAVVLLPNTERVDLIIRNTGIVDCNIARGRVAVLARGYLLKAGELYIINSDNLYRGAISAITTSGVTTLRISERSK